jgi:hypothetical protein
LSLFLTFNYTNLFVFPVYFLYNFQLGNFLPVYKALLQDFRVCINNVQIVHFQASIVRRRM